MIRFRISRIRSRRMRLRSRIWATSAWCSEATLRKASGDTATSAALLALSSSTWLPLFGAEPFFPVKEDSAMSSAYELGRSGANIFSLPAEKRQRHEQERGSDRPDDPLEEAGGPE